MSGRGTAPAGGLLGTDRDNVAWPDARQSPKDTPHQRLQIRHAVRSGPKDQDTHAQRFGVLLMLEPPIHRHKDVEALSRSLKQLPVRGPRPTESLHAADLMPRYCGRKVTGDILVKQNAHWLGRNSWRARARRLPAPGRRMETGPGTGRACPRPPDSRTMSERAPAYPQRPASRRGPRDRHGQRKAVLTCSTWVSTVYAHPVSCAYPVAKVPLHPNGAVFRLALRADGSWLRAPQTARRLTS